MKEKEDGFGSVWGHWDESGAQGGENRNAVKPPPPQPPPRGTAQFVAKNSSFKMPNHAPIEVTPPVTEPYEGGESDVLSHLEEEIDATIHDITGNTVQLEKEILASGMQRESDHTAEELAENLQRDLQKTISAEREALLHSGYVPYSPKQHTAPPPNINRPTHGTPHRTVKNPEVRTIFVGFPTAVFSLLFFGALFTVCLFFPAGELFPLRFAPLILFFLGIELFVRFFSSRSAGSGRRIVLDSACVFLMASCVVVSAVMSAASVTLADSVSERAALSTNIARDVEVALEHSIIDASRDYPDSLRLESVSCAFDANNASLGGYFSIKDIKDTDTLSLTVTFGGTPKSVKDFAEQTRVCLDIIADMKLPAENIDFRVADIYSHVDCHINGRTEMSLPVAEIAAKTTFFIDTDARNFADLNDYE